MAAPNWWFHEQQELTFLCTISTELLQKQKNKYWMAIIEIDINSAVVGRGDDIEARLLIER